jgi:hypothetical protein
VKEWKRQKQCLPDLRFAQQSRLGLINSSWIGVRCKCVDSSMAPVQGFGMSRSSAGMEAHDGFTLDFLPGLGKRIRFGVLGRPNLAICGRREARHTTFAGYFNERGKRANAFRCIQELSGSDRLKKSQVSFNCIAERRENNLSSGQLSLSLIQDTSYGSINLQSQETVNTYALSGLCSRNHPNQMANVTSTHVKQLVLLLLKDIVNDPGCCIRRTIQISKRHDVGISGASNIGIWRFLIVSPCNDVRKQIDG